MAHTFANILLHVVFSTKDRGKDLTAEVRSELYAYLTALAADRKSKAYAVGGGLDHVHLLLNVSPSVAPSDLVRHLKANSSRWIRERFNPHFAWQPGYAVFSVSHSDVPQVHDYIEHQREHQQKMSYEEELVALLKRNEIDFDNERLWNAS